MNKTYKRPVFKQVNQDQQMLIPPSLEDFIEDKHPVRVVNNVINRIDLKPLYDRYQGGGASSYDPRMMLKILIFAYLSNIFSSRKIEAALKENVHFMWISGMNTPDHNSINRFRSDRLKRVLKQLFAEIVKLLNEEGVVCIKDIYTDGTKLEANANKYSFVWGKSIKTRKEKIAAQIDELWKYAETVTQRELTDTAPTCYKEINPEKVAKTIEKIDNYLKGYEIDKKVREKLTRVKKNGLNN
jgi:transposase